MSVAGARKKYIEHEKKRVQNMTDDILETRYGRMKDPEKIRAFHQVLTETKRNEYLRRRIERDHPKMGLKQTKLSDIADVKNEWVVFRENPEHGFNHEYITFTLPAAFGEGVTPYLLVSKASPMRVHNETVQHSTDIARQLWDKLMKDGWRLETL